MRGEHQDLKTIESVFLNKKYITANTDQKINIIKKHIPERLYGKRHDRILKYIEYQKGFDEAKKTYEERKNG